MENRMKAMRILFISVISVCFFVPQAFAAVKDTDLDGLTDESEVSIYHTDPTIFDTDGDGVGDGQEVLDKTDPLDRASSRVVELAAMDEGLVSDPTKYAWSVGRAAGVLSFILLTIVVVHGLIISSRAFFRVYAPPVALEVHRFLSWMALVVVGIHVGALTFDQYFKLTWFEAFVPFSLSRPFHTMLGFDTGLAASLGSVAFYLILILILTSEFRSKMPQKIWRAIHYTSFAAYGLFVAHGYMSGTDSKEGWMRGIYIGSVAIVGILVGIRLVFRNRLQRIRAKMTDAASASSEPQ